MFGRILLVTLFVSAVLGGIRLESPPRPSSNFKNGWKLESSEVDLSAQHKLVFALKQQNLDQLQAILERNSDPRNPNYAKHLTKQQVDELVAPKPETRETILNWISQHEGQEVKDFGDFISAYFKLSTIQNAFECKFERYSHPDSKSKILRSASGYKVPSELANHLDFVGGIQRFPSIRRVKLEKPKVGEEPGVGVTPRIVRDRYEVDVYGSAPSNRQAVAQFLEQYYSPADLQEFFLLFFWEGIGQGPDVVGPNYAYEAGVEATLDIQYIMSVGANIPTTFYSTPGLHDGQEPFLEWAILVSNTSDSALPKVISVSYGDDEDSLDISYTQRINVEFQKIGVRGVSIFFASGDDGVGCNDQGTQFVPNYPASSPWVTAVGGTFTDDVFELGPEVVNSLSGGGFSNYFPAPSYQTQAIANYLATAQDLPATSFYNRSGRAYPDVSALSSAFTVVINLIPFPGVSGTSAASPSFAGVIATVNDVRLQNDKAPLGFLNPLIYQHPEVFFDVTDGCNPGGCPNDGFCAQAGWDPSSGWGSPLFSNFIKLALSLP